MPIKDIEKRREAVRRNDAKIAADPKRLAIRRAQQRAAHKRRYEADPEKYRAKGRRYYAANTASELARAAAWRKDNPDYYSKYNRKYLYGLEADVYDALLVKQNGHCFFCSRTRVVVDHCHKTGRVRGLVCKNHNNMLRAFGDDIEGAERLLKYMKGT